ncbi:MAG: hypothetical protein KDD02_26595, partial [Phaeodactylibacter sp.]|nr:hypothetical protein [Phaeodactylibacter sp.]
MTQFTFRSAFFQFIYTAIALASLLSPKVGWGQCPTIQAIMVDACSTIPTEEGLNEFIIINSGGGFNTNTLYLDFDNNNNNFGQQNNDINFNNGNDPVNPTPCGLQPGNPSLISGCNAIPIGPGFNVPPNSTVILQTSNGANTAYDFSNICSPGQCVYVIQNACTRTAGGFTNSGAGTRITIIGLTTPACSNAYIYDRAQLVGGDGAYFIPFSTYGNGGCAAPPVT